MAQPVHHPGLLLSQPDRLADPTSLKQSAARRPRRHVSWWARPLERSLVIGVGIFLVGLLLAGVVLDRAYQNRALPGVRYGTLSFSGLSETQVQGLLNVYITPLLASPVVFVLGEREWRPPAAEMGLAIDSPAMAREALAIRQAVPAPLRLPHALFLGTVRPAIGLRATINEPQLTAFLSAVAAEVDKAPLNAALSVKDGELVVGQSAPGIRVDVPTTIRRVQPPTTLDEPQQVEVATITDQPALPDASITEARAVVAKILSAPLTIKAGTRIWTLSPAQLGNMLEIKPSGTVKEGGHEQLVASLSEPKVVTFVRSIAAQIDRAPVEAQLRWSGSSVVVVRESREGVKLEQAEAVKAIITQATQDEREVVLHTTVIKPQVASDNLPALGITQLLATGTSKFAGSSPERVNNIQVAASRLNGTVIAPGATFSFLDSLGPIIKANGYKEGLTIQGDATVPGIGGGVCQVSTTAFRAAFYAGLPIAERHQHTYRVSYYEQDGSPVGFDAAVYDPGVDLRFKNDTGAAVLIQTGVDPGSATLAFRFYGTPTGREVSLSAAKANEVKAGPPLPDGTDPSLPKGVRKQVEWRADGVDATIGRSVVQGGQSLLNDSFFSRYMPWREKWVAGTAGAAPATPATPAGPAT